MAIINNLDFSVLMTVSEFILQFTLCVIAIYVIRYKIRNRRRDALAAKVPGPRALPIIGNALELLGSTSDIMKAMDRMAKTHPSPMRFWLGPMLTFIIHDPEDFEVVLNSKVALEKDVIYTFFEPHLGQGLLTAPVSVWHRHRRIIGPMFNSLILQSYFRVFNRQAKMLAENLAPLCVEGRQFDVFNFIAMCTHNISCETMTGIEERAQDESCMTYVEALLRGSFIVSKRCFTFWLYPDCLYNLTKYARIDKEIIHVINDKVQLVINRKKEDQKLRRLGKLENKKEQDDKPKRKSFLEHLIDSKENFTDKELLDEAATHMATAFDTTAVADSTVLLLLAIHQDEQAKVYEELRDIFGDSDRDVTMEDANLMTRMEMVMNEAMRLFTLVPIFTRELAEDLEVKNYTLPKGSSLVLWTQTMHRNSEIYPDPDLFDPERFLPENVKKRHRYSFLPFSAGPRNCVGLRYALFLSKVLLATVIRKYQVHTDIKMQDIKLKHEVLQKSIDGYPIRLELRNI